MTNDYPRIEPDVVLWELSEEDHPLQYKGCIGYYAHGLWEAKSFLAAVIEKFDIELEDLNMEYQGVCHGVGELDEEEFFWVPSRRLEDKNVDPQKAEFPVTFYLLPF